MVHVGNWVNSFTAVIFHLISYVSQCYLVFPVFLGMEYHPSNILAV